MAVTALDDANPPRYWRGRDSNAAALGYDGNERGWRQAREASQKLISAGAIELYRSARPGLSNEYVFTKRVTEQRIDGYVSAVPIAESMSTSQPSDEYVSAVEMGTSQTYPKEESGTKKEESAPPTRSCTRHQTWEHDQPCRPCGQDRRAAEKQNANHTPSQNEQRATPRTLTQLTGSERSAVDAAARGFGSVPDELLPALEEARRERESI
ncbi:hypothetical protein FHX48_000698 [Microbacterium halimionae]|uniref:Uncharacterized protein n=1 Tax=Microbacterium halimionae TaxID=1526413 RepID=A0A7W3JML5_9MICO|nr:hypothetical protein [Microbacterium halimionae]MBA8815646.1 hypothetical protein [Microbacterium halimionae]NII95693.1 hypothetical protein [Microbacterium halimionae]